MNEEIVKLIEKQYPFKDNQRKRWGEIKNKIIHSRRIDSDNIVSLDKVLSGLRDGHTRIRDISRKENIMMFPIDIEWFGDKLVWRNNSVLEQVHFINDMDISSIIDMYGNNYEFGDLIVKKQILNDIKQGADIFNFETLSINGNIIEKVNVSDLLAELNAYQIKEIEKLKKVLSVKIDKNTLLIRISSFYKQDIVNDIKGLLDRIKKEQYENIIIDIRDNQGGYINVAEAVASLFIPKNVVLDFEIVDCENNCKEIYIKTKQRDFINKYKVFLFINENTQSCSEYIFGRALKLTIPNLLIVGKHTAGLSGQAKEYIIDGKYLLSVTTKRYVDSITGEEVGYGLKPDVILSYDLENDTVDYYLDWYKKRKEYE